MDKLSQYIESLIFVADTPISVKDIRDSLLASIKLKTSKKEVEEAIEGLQKKYKKDKFSFELIGISEGFQFMTKAAYHDVVGMYLRIQSKKKLSRASMETLAIIAYKQPMTKSGIESIRGVNCDYAVLKLVEKELVEILGRADTPGRPILYGTSDKFMDYFGIRDITDLPKLKEIIVSESSIGMEEGLSKMHTEGLTEDFRFLPNAEPEITKELSSEKEEGPISTDGVEVTQEIETTDKETISEDVASEDVSDVVSEDVSDVVSEDVSDVVSEDVSDVVSEDVVSEADAVEETVDTETDESAITEDPVDNIEVEENNNIENRNEQEEESVNSEEN